jgi:hypothetical protein
MKHFLGYHMHHKYGPFSGHIFFTNKTLDREGEHVLYVVSGHKLGNQPVDYRLEGKYAIKTIEVNDAAKFSTMRWKLSLEPLSVLDPSMPLSNIESFDKGWFHDNFTSGQGIAAISGDRRAVVDLFEQLLPPETKSTSTELYHDLMDIERDPDISDATEREEIRNARIGQGRFRRNTIAAWGGQERCAVTGIAMPTLLNCSHILPWREATNRQRLSGGNGMLLCTHLDRLFDRYLVGFERTARPDLYQLVFSERVTKHAAELQLIGISKAMKLSLEAVRFTEKAEIEINLANHLSGVLAK